MYSNRFMRFVAFYYNMKALRVTILLVLVVWLQAISITVTSMKERCMIVSSNSNEQFLKTDLRFTKFSDQSLEEGYRIVLHNTETHEEQAYQISEGSFRKEFQLTEHVVYKFCFKVVLSRPREIRAIMEYNADVTHRQNVFQANITVPANLLKVQDLQNTYRNLASLGILLRHVNMATSNIKQEEDQIFEEQNQQMKTLTLISAIEIIVVIGFGIYQYFRLKTLIENKH